jgi:phospholipid/cholesterol/gamma-HCH transport system substrate-binding protein
MENRAYALIVGLFVIGLGAAGVAAFWWISGGAENTTEYLIVSHRNVTGLNPQAAVRYRGVRVGKVLDVDLQDSREVSILLRVDASVPITRGTRARIGTQGLTGQGYVQLDDDGSDPVPPVLAPGGKLPMITMQSGTLMETATEGAQEIVARLRRSSERVEQILSEQNVERIDTTLKNLAASSDHLEKSLAQVSLLASDMRRFSSPENADRLSTTLAQLQTTTHELPAAVADFRSALGKIDAAASRVDKLGGDVQANLNSETLPRVNELMLGLQASSQQLSRVLDDIERTPQVLLLGKRQQAPGPGETSSTTP